eukprot:TRINITY_DN4119_c0_g1_i1.p1 TRINITY_DN4119_c0_g1~~TRINITY_DN4119_c0_g1_i1.p1  ORF type:complete len:184 (-),score=38.06 TRINITY_DN4119_c0_g1_i1:71-622(-)
MATYKLVVVGGVGVGKTALTIQLVSNHFVEDYDPTVEDSYRKRVTIDDIVGLLEILDTAGDYTTTRADFLRPVQGFLCVYDITSRKSFDGLREQILTLKSEKAVHITLVGNKSDLENERAVARVEGSDMARVFECDFFETSAKLRVNIEESFYNLVRQIRKSTEGTGGGKVTKKNALSKCSLY